MKADIIDTVTQIVERAGKAAGIEPVEVVWAGSGKNRLLRIFIDKPGGVTHADCEEISRYTGAVLDAEDLIPGARYTLEVSSPGLERKLTKPRDFERHAGQRIKAVLLQPLSGKTVWKGELVSFADGVITLRPDGGEPVSFPLSQVSRANLEFEW